MTMWVVSIGHKLLVFMMKARCLKMFEDGVDRGNLHGNAHFLIELLLLNGIGRIRLPLDCRETGTAARHLYEPLESEAFVSIY